MKRVYPDTNIALHCRRFDEIDWLGVLETEAVVVVISSQFQRELEKKKYDAPTSRIKARAREFSAWLDKLEDGALIRAGVTIEFMLRAPGVGFDFAAHDLDREDGDDCHLACMLRDLERVALADIALFTNDGGIRRKAASRGIAVVVPSQHELLGDEPDPLRKELDEARRELARANNTRASLALSFAGGHSHSSVELEVPIFTEDDLRRVVRAERHRHDREREQNPLLRPWDLYEPNLKEWLRESASIAQWNALGITIDLVLSNVGRGLATSIAIELTTSAPLRFREEAVRGFPKPPRWLSFGTALYPDIGEIVPRRFDAHDEVLFVEKDPRRLRIRALDLNHEDSRSMPPVFVEFECEADVTTGFSVDYRIFAATQTTPKTGSLHCQVTKSRKRFDVPDLRADET
jgi:hypothetical protein